MSCLVSFNFVSVVVGGVFFSFFLFLGDFFLHSCCFVCLSFVFFCLFVVVVVFFWGGSVNTLN